MQIEIFNSANYNDVESAVNKFIKGKIIIDIKLSCFSKKRLYYISNL